MGISQVGQYPTLSRSQKPDLTTNYAHAPANIIVASQEPCAYKRQQFGTGRFRIVDIADIM